MSARACKFLLVGSLVLNVFLLGGVAGGAYQWFAGHGRPTTAAAQPRALRFAAEELSADRQKQFFTALKEARREAREYAREGREQRREVLRLLAAPQLDRTALDMALNRTRAADIALRSRIEQGVADFAATLSPDERVKFAEGLSERGQWRLPQSPAQGQSQPRQQQEQNQQPATD
ncbi:periplasmic heavy metal sensor [Paraburkholderia phymatum]|uniref:Putative membrane-associated protein n=1 Tax=Paraburkholderia phymatum (strain DSM 17167 / CIP 108236 / LMG 21445 / STM815) TaxID=391038 RepID=B2JPM0_PARP8|nr:periplasmic heavy metal sensor [Paraburkholderia phymatum]ACC73211.1 putative membrane-associated protein [Paraburkholderia phymatum STM815]